MEDVDYFRKKLYKALNVPSSRLESENTFNLGRAAEISRDELKFTKFIHRLRSRFAGLFDDALELQLSLKGIMSREEWKSVREHVFYDWTKDNYFTELKESELINSRLEMLDRVDNYVGKYYSQTWVQKNILRMNEKEIEDMQAQIDDEGGGEDDDDWEEQREDQPQIINSSEEK